MMASASTWTLLRPDGVDIAVHSRGEGPGVLLVHGTACDHRVWGRVAHRLAESYTVHALDRRGRGESGDASDWSLDLDIDDVAAITEKLGHEVPIVGHSLGAILALEAGLRTDHGGPIVAYEPPVYAEGGPPQEAADELERVLSSEGPEAAVEGFLREVGYDDAQLESLRRNDAIWQATLATAHTLPREARADLAYEIDADRLAGLRRSVLLLKGDDSPDTFQPGLTRLAEALPEVTRAQIPGARHGVLHEAPQAFADEVTDFLAAQR